jgi:large subunit ribosomal protein L22
VCSDAYLPLLAEAWVGKSLAQKRIDIKGRGRFGIRITRYSHLHIVLRQGLTDAERLEKVRQYKLNRVRSAGLVREDTPLRNVGPTWTW